MCGCLLAGCPSPDAASAPPDALVAECNRVRLAHRLPPVESDAALDRVARARAERLASGAPFSHDDTDGRDMRALLTDPSFGVARRWREAREILAVNRAADPDDEAVRGWMASPRHRATLLDPEARKVGSARVRAPDGRAYRVMVWTTPWR